MKKFNVLALVLILSATMLTACRGGMNTDETTLIPNTATSAATVPSRMPTTQPTTIAPRPSTQATTAPDTRQTILPSSSDSESNRGTDSTAAPSTAAPSEQARTGRKDTVRSFRKF